MLGAEFGLDVREDVLEGVRDVQGRHGKKEKL